MLLRYFIRSFDLGGDKFPVAFKSSPEANPFLGWRSIRVCLDEPEVFRPQVRAVLRAAVGRDIQFMLPLVTRVEEVIVRSGRAAVRYHLCHSSRSISHLCTNLKQGPCQTVTPRLALRRPAT